MSPALWVAYGVIGLLFFGVTLEDDDGSTDRYILTMLMAAVWPATAEAKAYAEAKKGRHNG